MFRHVNGNRRLLVLTGCGDVIRRSSKTGSRFITNHAEVQESPGQSQTTNNESRNESRITDLSSEFTNNESRILRLYNDFRITTPALSIQRATFMFLLWAPGSLYGKDLRKTSAHLPQTVHVLQDQLMAFRGPLLPARRAHKAQPRTSIRHGSQDHLLTWC